MEKYDSFHHEIYALIAIHIAYPHLFGEMKKGEHPDWQDNMNDIGLEVTIAQTKHMGYVKKLANRYLGKDIKSVPMNNRKGFQGDFITNKGKLFSISDSKGSVDGTRHIKLAITSITTKLGKLNSKHFNLFAHNMIFIFLSFTANDADVKLFCDMYKDIEKEFKNHFTIIFLFDYSSLIKITLGEIAIARYVYTEEQISYIKRETLRLREKGDWSDGAELILKTEPTNKPEE